MDNAGADAKPASLSDKHREREHMKNSETRERENTVKSSEKRSDKHSDKRSEKTGGGNCEKLASVQAARRG